MYIIHLLAVALAVVSCLGAIVSVVEYATNGLDLIALVEVLGLWGAMAAVALAVHWLSREPRP